MNNLQNVFDAIVGYNGSAATDGWKEMPRAELIENAEAQASEFYEAISSAEAAKIADAVIAYRAADTQDDKYHVRDSLSENIKQITAERAAEIIADESAEYLPFRTLNQAGRTAITTWVKTTAKQSGHELDAWYSDAEKAANDASPGEAVIIEMRAHSAASGKPETLELPGDAFDWKINESPFQS